MWKAGDARVGGCEVTQADGVSTHHQSAGTVAANAHSFVGGRGARLCAGQVASRGTRWIPRYVSQLAMAWALTCIIIR